MPTPSPTRSCRCAAKFVDENGKPRTLGDAIGNRPAVVVFADYTCKTLCGPILAFAAGGLAKTGLVAGRDFHLVVIGIDPKDSLRRCAGDENVARRQRDAARQTTR